jgi:hypothetical protein
MHFVWLPGGKYRACSMPHEPGLATQSTCLDRSCGLLKPCASVPPNAAAGHLTATDSHIHQPPLTGVLDSQTLGESRDVPGCPGSVVWRSGMRGPPEKSAPSGSQMPGEYFWNILANGGAGLRRAIGILNLSPEILDFLIFIPYVPDAVGRAADYAVR